MGALQLSKSCLTLGSGADSQGRLVTTWPVEIFLSTGCLGQVSFLRFKHWNLVRQKSHLLHICHFHTTLEIFFKALCKLYFVPCAALHWADKVMGLIQAWDGEILILKILGSCLHLVFEVWAYSRCAFDATDFFILFCLQSPLLGAHWHNRVGKTLSWSFTSGNLLSSEGDSYRKKLYCKP